MPLSTPSRLMATSAEILIRTFCNSIFEHLAHITALKKKIFRWSLGNVAP